MPRMMVPVDTESQTIVGPGTFQFSAARPEILGATEYTLVSLAVDISSSVFEFKTELEEMIRNVVEACSKTSRVDNLMLRLTTFNTQLDEIHGFVPLNKINAADYPSLSPRGMTALYDAAYEAVAATVQYATTLTDQDYDVNAIVFVITDGVDNSSTVSPTNVAEVVRKSKIVEALDSIQTVLVGVNDGYCRDYLDEFKTRAEIDEYVSVGNATPEALAKLGRFISKSVSTTSQALGSGTSVSLTF